MSRDVFRPIHAVERAAQLRAYAWFLAERDGEPDFARRTLPNRESATRRFEEAPACFDGPFDEARFAAQLARFDRRRPTSPEELLLLAFVKTNANEAFAVDRVLARVLFAGDALAQRLERVVLLEETYHTRLLVSAARLFGAAVPATPRPVPVVRALVAGIADLPDFASRAVSCAGEIAGILTFLRMLSAIGRLLRHRPALRDGFEERATEVLIDEVGHLSFNRLLMGPVQLATARAILPLVALGTRGALPEAELLGVLPLPLSEVMSFELRSLPEEVRRRAYVA